MRACASASATYIVSDSMSCGIAIAMYQRRGIASQRGLSRVKRPKDERILPTRSSDGSELYLNV